MSNCFIETDEIKDFRVVLRTFFRNKYSEEIRKKFILSPGDFSSREILKSDKAKSLLKEFLDLGPYQTIIPEEYGGLGFSKQALNVIVEECAKVLFPFNIFEYLIFGLLPLTEFARKESLVNYLNSGKTTTASLNIFSEYKKLGFSRKDNNNVIICGSLKYVSGVEQADNILLPVLADNLLYISLIDISSADFISYKQLSDLDLYREYYEVKFNSARAEIISEVINEDRLKSFSLLVACYSVIELVAVVRASLEMTISYVKERKQFARSIGSFQAIQHKLADVYLKSEEISSLINYAISEYDNDTTQFISAANAAIAYSIDVLPKAIEDCLQAHGGIGFTYEYPLHYFLRRAQSISLQLEKLGFNYSNVSSLELSKNT